ncbi:COX15/CtaA family protein [Bacteroidota bacterium]|nr:COX15/CtaA family protein [Bacteroidota bacterium]
MRFNGATLIMIYLVIIAGSIVRITESGMGCPDWPKCFDQYIPPIDISELPENYQYYYSSVREKKIKKFTSFLKSIGLEEKAILIESDKSLLYEQPFNVWNTWLEYINRLIGALAGLFIFGGFILALKQKKDKILKSLLAFGLILLTFFQAWWGSMVVATNIVPWVLTVHMVIAALMITWQILIISFWNRSTISIPKSLKLIALFGTLFFLFQIIVGTQVRQIVDHWLESSSRNDLLLEKFQLFISHRTIALFIVLFSLFLGLYAYVKKIKILEIYIFLFCVLLEGLVGKILADFNLPYILQPIHLLLAMISFGCMSRLLFNYKISNN